MALVCCFSCHSNEITSAILLLPHFVNSPGKSVTQLGNGSRSCLYFLFVFVHSATPSTAAEFLYFHRLPCPRCLCRSAELFSSLPGRSQLSVPAALCRQSSPGQLYGCVRAQRRRRGAAISSPLRHSCIPASPLLQVLPGRSCSASLQLCAESRKPSRSLGKKAAQKPIAFFFFFFFFTLSPSICHRN